MEMNEKNQEAENKDLASSTENDKINNGQDQSAPEDQKDQGEAIPDSQPVNKDEKTGDFPIEENSSENTLEETPSDPAEEKVSAPEESPSEEQPAQVESTTVETPVENEGDEIDPEGEEDHDDHHEEEDHEDHEDHEEEDYSHYSKEELLEKIKELTSAENPLRVNRQVQEVKKYFQILVDEERKKALEQFVAEGNSEIDFKPVPDKTRKEFFNYFGLFKTNKKDFIRKSNAEKEENLKRKEEILDKIREIANTDELEGGFQNFKKLQDEWRSIGHVPKTDFENLNKNYHTLVNKFFDNLNLYSEFKDLDRKKNLESKTEVIEKLEELPKLNNLQELKKQFRSLQQEWNYIGPVPKDNLEEVLNRFDKAMAEILKKIEEIEEELQKVREENLRKKQEIIGRIMEFENFHANNPKDWIRKNDELGKIINEWKKIGHVPYQDKDEISKQFRNAVRGFNKQKNDFFKDKKKEKVENLQRKQELIEEAKKLLNPENFKDAKNKLLDLQAQWKKVGPVPQKYSDPVWKDFRAVCDEFFNQLSDFYKGRDVEEQENLKKKEEICAKAEELSSKKVENPETTVKSLQEEWLAIGYVPFKEKDKVNSRFNNALKTILKTSKDNLTGDPDILNYKLKVEGLKDQGNNQVKSEERKLLQELKRNEEEINTLETNIQFFSSSNKKANSLIDNYRKKIDDLKDKSARIKEKLDIIQE